MSLLASQCGPRSHVQASPTCAAAVSAPASAASPSHAPDLPAVFPCGLEANLRSRNGAPIALRITNATERPVHIYWLDYHGNRKSYGSVAPGESADHRTYEGHAWVATDDAGQCAALALAGPSTPEFRVTSLPPPPPDIPTSLPVPPASLGLDAFYRKYVDANGVPVISSARVTDEGLLAAREIVIQMLRRRRDARDAIVRAHVRVVVMAPQEQTLDVPEHADLAGTPTDRPGVDWNERARGLGATKIRPATSCGEENLLCLEVDRYRGENILIHEFGHTIAEIGLEDDAGFQRGLRAAYDAAMAKAIWHGTYVATNANEYWAEGVQDWFDANLHDVAEHNEVHTRARLKTYDPALYALLARVFEDDEWRYHCPGKPEGPASHS